MQRVSNGTAIVIRWGLGIVAAILVAGIMFNVRSFSGELKKLREANTEAKERLGVMETMVGNIKDDVKEIKQTVKESQEQDKELNNNIVEIKELIMQQEMRRLRERPARTSRDPLQPSTP